jgi:predicted lipoprotein with Yx(FWY)xxD motif
LDRYWLDRDGDNAGMARAARRAAKRWRPFTQHIAAKGWHNYNVCSRKLALRNRHG